MPSISPHRQGQLLCSSSQPFAGGECSVKSPLKQQAHVALGLKEPAVQSLLSVSASEPSLVTIPMDTILWLSDEEADALETAAALLQKSSGKEASRGASAVVRRVVYPPLFGQQELALRTFHDCSTLPLQSDDDFAQFVSNMLRLKDLPNGTCLLGAHRARQWTVWPFYGGCSLEERIARGDMTLRERADFAFNFLSWVQKLPMFLSPSPEEAKNGLASVIIHCDLKVITH